MKYSIYKNLLNLASSLKGSYSSGWYSQQEIYGLLLGLRFNKQITNNDIDLVLKYIFPRSYFSTYTEEDIELPKIKNKLSRISFEISTLSQRISN